MYCRICGRNSIWVHHFPSGDCLCSGCWSWAWHLGLNPYSLKWGRGSLHPEKVAWLK